MRDKRCKIRARDKGLTLIEMTVVIVIVVLLTSFALPAIRMLFNSFQSQSGTRAMISASLASARAIAAEHQHYAGIRFQNKYQEDGKGCQYMVFIIHDSEILANGFRGIEPIKLPDSVGVMDLKLGSTNPEQIVDSDGRINDDWEVADTTTFSIIFSPSGKLVIHDVQVRNRNGLYQPDNGDANPDKHSMDDIFNSLKNIEDYNIGMFVQDDYPSDGFDKEPSRNSFVIYDRKEFDKVGVSTRWSDYLYKLERIYINPYIGTMINQ